MRMRAERSQPSRAAICGFEYLAALLGVDERVCGESSRERKRGRELGLRPVGARALEQPRRQREDRARCVQVSDRMEYLCNLNLSPQREAMYKAILLEEEIDEQVLRLMDAPPIAEDIAAHTMIPLAICRRLVDAACSDDHVVVLPHSPPDEHPPRSPSAHCDSSSSSDESEEEEQQSPSNYPSIRSPQALRSLVRFIHNEVDEAAQAQADQERRAAEHADAEKAARQRAAAALQEESDRLMTELRLKNERQQKQQQVIQTIVCAAYR